MAEFSFLTVAGESTGLFKDKGSKFHAFVIPVQNESEIKQNLERLRKEFFDARHHCFAWVLGPDKQMFRASDDGEPNHSAGDPILGQIRSKNLTNVLIVVVRYFGGIKLGVGGLISAYRTAAKAALDNAVIVEKEVKHDLILKYNYDQTPEVMKLIKTFDLPILSQDFRSLCMVRTAIAIKNKTKFIEKTELLKATGSPIEIEWLVE